MNVLTASPISNRALRMTKSAKQLTKIGTLLPTKQRLRFHNRRNSGITSVDGVH